MINFITEPDLKGYAPELDRLLWSDQADYSKQKSVAEITVTNDLISRGYKLRQLQTPLIITTESKEDKLSRNRVIISGTATLKGSNDNENFINVATQSKVLTQTFRYYQKSGSGAVKLYETVFDLLFVYKWLETIMLDKFNQDGDQYWNRMVYFRDSYNNYINKATFSVDENDDGNIDEKEITKLNIIERVI